MTLVGSVTVEEGKNKEDATMQEELAVAVNNSTEPQAAVAVSRPRSERLRAGPAGRVAGRGPVSRESGGWRIATAGDAA